MKYEDYLAHFNPNHDPRNGQFTGKNGNTSNAERYTQTNGVSHIKEKITKAGSKKLTAEQKRLVTITASAIITTGIIVGISMALRIHATEKIKETLVSGVTDVNKYKDVMTQAIDDEIEILKSGTVIDRIQFGSGVDVSKKDDITFVTCDEKDKIAYMLFLQDIGSTGLPKHHAVYETIKDIKLPTEKKAKEIFHQLWSENPKYRDALKKTIREYVRGLSNSYADATDEYIDNEVVPYLFGKTKDDLFYRGMWTFGKRSDDSKIFIDELKKQGYGGIVDYYDKYLNEIAKAPIILFDPKSSLVKKGEEMVTKATVSEKLKELLQEGEKTLPIRLPDISNLNDKNGNLDIKKLLKAIKEGSELFEI